MVARPVLSRYAAGRSSGLACLPQAGLLCDLCGTWVHIHDGSPPGTEEPGCGDGIWSRAVLRARLVTCCRRGWNAPALVQRRGTRRVCGSCFAGGTVRTACVASAPVAASATVKPAAPFPREPATFPATCLPCCTACWAVMPQTWSGQVGHRRAVPAGVVVRGAGYRHELVDHQPAPVGLQVQAVHQRIGAGPVPVITRPGNCVRR
jgi:hypothetical protein